MHETQLIETLHDYVKRAETDYSLLISGGWGTGKTYMIKKVFAPQIETYGYKFLYISLYGLKSADDLAGAMAVNLFPEKYSEFTGKYAVFGARFIAEKLKLPGLASAIVRDVVTSKKSKILYCFDDLERSTDIESMLSFISTLVEGLGEKVIIISAEREIPPDQRPKYDTRKEKVVGYTLAFTPQVENIIQNLISSLPDEHNIRKFLSSQVKLIDEAVNRSGEPNLRSLKHALRLFHRIYSEIEMADLPATRLGPTILRLIVGIASEMRRDESNKKRLGRAPNISEVALHMKVNRKGPEPDLEAVYLKEFFEKFGDPVLLQTPGYSSVFTYVLDGHLDVKTLVVEAMQHLHKIDPRPDAPEQAFLQDYRELTDEQFDQQVQNYIEKLHLHEINDVIQLYKVGARLVYFSEEGLLAEKPEAIVELLDSTLDHQVKTHTLVALNSAEFEKGTILRYGEPDNPGFLTFVEKLDKANKEFLEDATRKRVEDLFKMANSNHAEFLKALAEELSNSSNLEPRFKYCNPAELASAIASFTPQEATQLGRIVEARHNYVNVSDFLSGDSEPLGRLAEALEGAIHGRKTSLSKYFLSLLVKRFRVLSKKLKKD